MMKPVVALLVLGLSAATASASQAHGGGQFGQGHPTKPRCPPQTRVERFIVAMTHACGKAVAAPPAPKPSA